LSCNAALDLEAPVTGAASYKLSNKPHNQD
jgi:hypothetical protein